MLACFSFSLILVLTPLPCFSLKSLAHSKLLRKSWLRAEPDVFEFDEPRVHAEKLNLDFGYWEAEKDTTREKEKGKWDIRSLVVRTYETQAEGGRALFAGGTSRAACVSLA